jgi:hypothetical protein
MLVGWFGRHDAARLALRSGPRLRRRPLAATRPAAFRPQMVDGLMQLKL